MMDQTVFASCHTAEQGSTCSLLNYHGLETEDLGSLTFGAAAASPKQEMADFFNFSSNFEEEYSSNSKPAPVLFPIENPTEDPTFEDKTIASSHTSSLLAGVVPGTLTRKEIRRILEAYKARKGGEWSFKFMEKLANRLGLKPVQVYKWKWDQEKKENKQNVFVVMKKPRVIFAVEKFANRC